MHGPSILRAATLFALTLICVACGDASGPSDSGPDGPVVLQIAAGGGQTGVVGAALSNPIAVVVTNEEGAPAAGVRVQFQPASGAGSVSPANVTTDADGRAAAAWTLGTVAGEQRLTASAGSASVELVATASAGPPVTFEILLDSVSLEPGMDSVLQFVARDGYGNANVTTAPVWSVDDPSVATIAAGGAILALSPGRTMARARLGALEASVPVSIGFRFVDVATGYDHVCATTAGDRVHCWGLTREYQAGQPRPGVSCESGAFCLTSPRLLTDDVGFDDVAPGAQHSCGIATDAGLYCWGGNTHLALGLGRIEWAYRTDRPELVDATRSYAAVAADDGWGCALTVHGEVYCWGRLGAIGAVGAGPVDRPLALPSPVPFVAIAVGTESACGLDAAGDAYCWGLNGHGELGLGDANPRTVPERVASSAVFRQISAGGHHSCAVADDGVAYCWGSNSHGQLGVAGTAGTSSPTAVATTERFTAIAAGGTHTCGVTTAGVAMCWGSNYEGQLGNGFVGSGPKVRAVAGDLRFIRIHGKRDFTCAVATDDRLYCWGDNDYGQIGDGSTTDRVAPVRVSGQM
jgi:alpha-tubulin suppressor-like RCC1 family protein